MTRTKVAVIGSGNIGTQSHDHDVVVGSVHRDSPPASSGTVISGVVVLRTACRNWANLSNTVSPTGLWPQILMPW